MRLSLAFVVTCLTSSVFSAVIPEDASALFAVQGDHRGGAAPAQEFRILPYEGEGDDDSDHPKHPKHPKHPGHRPHPPPEHEKPGDGDSNKSILEVLKDDPAFSILYRAISKRETIAKALNTSHADLTLFAPPDFAFRRHHRLPGKKPHHPPPEAITKGLLYHVVDKAHKAEDLKNGQLLDTGLTLASLGDRPQKIRVFEHDHHVALNWRSKIIKDNIAASNGIIQAIDHVLMPPPPVFYALAWFPQVFGLFTIALKRAGLKDAINDTAAITVFAPTNRAFKKLGIRKLKHLFSHKGKEELKKILSYHIGTELVYGSEIIDAKKKEIPTLEGSTILLEVKDSDDEHGHKHQVIEVNGSAHVWIPDGLAANGVIHSIDKVLSPIEEDVSGSEELEESLWDEIKEMVENAVEDFKEGFRWKF